VLLGQVRVVPVASGAYKFVVLKFVVSKAYMFKLGHEIRITEQLEAHHLRVLLHRPEQNLSNLSDARSKDKHLSVPVTGTRLRSRSSACSPMPHALIVALGSVSWRPSKDMICSLTGTPDFCVLERQYMSQTTCEEQQ
jgi:hypothetical protein